MGMVIIHRPNREGKRNRKLFLCGIEEAKQICRRLGHKTFLIETGKRRIRPKVSKREKSKSGTANKKNVSIKATWGSKSRLRSAYRRHRTGGRGRGTIQNFRSKIKVSTKKEPRVGSLQNIVPGEEETK